MNKSLFKKICDWCDKEIIDMTFMVQKPKSFECHKLCLECWEKEMKARKNDETNKTTKDL